MNAFRQRTLRLVRDIAHTQGFSVPGFTAHAETGVLVLQRAERSSLASEDGLYAGHFVYHFAPEGATLSFFGSGSDGEALPRASFAYFYLTESDWLHSIEPMYALLGELARPSSGWRLPER
jgi:hypothetical protein